MKRLLFGFHSSNGQDTYNKYTEAADHRLPFPREQAGLRGNLKVTGRKFKLMKEYTKE
ncbi:hypothetical protein GCM10008018_70930 [Paenibacillus marchantiophytorum]|uniref:YjzC family protein n=1 Tax=Paenibacillus marchantiophytorum TaxID=1619310 RepID=A0ABQ1FKB7_9BACL|nr:hypothetical protein GCM10008018_70930 [Paenibacillus marchantiophytorum]